MAISINSFNVYFIKIPFIQRTQWTKILSTHQFLSPYIFKFIYSIDFFIFSLFLDVDGGGDGEGNTVSLLDLFISWDGTQVQRILLPPSHIEFFSRAKTRDLLAWTSTSIDLNSWRSFPKVYFCMTTSYVNQ